MFSLSVAQAQHRVRDTWACLLDTGNENLFDLMFTTVFLGLNGMAKKKRIPAKYATWIEARKRHNLSHLQIQLARELGMNPKGFGKLDNHHQEPWKLPLGQFIEECYLKRFGEFPDKVISIEQRVKLDNQKKLARKEAKAASRAIAATSQDANEDAAPTDSTLDLEE